MNDDTIRTLVRDSLGAHADRLPVAAPPWDRVRAGMVDIRRERHRRQAFAALAAAVIVAVGVVRFDGLARDRAEVADPDDVRVRTSAIFGGRTVGSLAKDRAFLADLRRAFVASRGADYYGLRVPDTTTPADVLVPFAGDVGDVRLALLEVELVDGTTPIDQFLWFEAAAGASARVVLSEAAPSMEAADNDAWIWAPTPHSQVVSGGPRTGAFVYLSAVHGGDLQVGSGPTYAPDGTTSWSTRTVPKSSDRHWEVPLRWSDPLAQTLWFRHSASSWTQLDLPTADSLDASLFADSAPALRGTTPSTDLARFAVASAQREAGVAASASTRQVLWSGRSGRSRIVVAAVTVPGGAHVVVAAEARPNGAGSVTSGAVTVVPAGPLEKAGLAWMTDEQPPDPLPQSVDLLGPAGAVTVVVTDDSGRHTVRLDDGFGRVKVVRPTLAEFRDAAGRTLATTSDFLGRTKVGPPDTP